MIFIRIQFQLLCESGTGWSIRQHISHLYIQCKCWKNINTYILREHRDIDSESAGSISDDETVGHTPGPWLCKESGKPSILQQLASAVGFVSNAWMDGEAIISDQNNLLFNLYHRPLTSTGDTSDDTKQCVMHRGLHATPRGETAQKPCPAARHATTPTSRVSSRRCRSSVALITLPVGR